MMEPYIDLDALSAFVDELAADPEKGTKTAIKEAVEAYIAGAEKLEIVRCKNCNTFSTAGVAEGYGWCKKFCFGPEKDFFCLLGAPWDDEPVSEKQTDEQENGGNE